MLENPNITLERRMKPQNTCADGFINRLGWDKVYERGGDLSVGEGQLLTLPERWLPMPTSLFWMEPLR